MLFLFRSLSFCRPLLLSLPTKGRFALLVVEAIDKEERRLSARDLFLFSLPFPVSPCKFFHRGDSHQHDHSFDENLDDFSYSSSLGFFRSLLLCFFSLTSAASPPPPPSPFFSQSCSLCLLKLSVLFSLLL